MVSFDTTEYEFSHGHTPRGRGGWAFRFLTMDGAVRNEAEVARSPHADPEVFWAPSPLLFGEAKKWARAKARELGACDVEICT